MAELFQKDVRTINEHIKNVFKEGELLLEAVIRRFRITDGKSYDTAHYNLDVIVSVGYRVKSIRGTQIGIWATSVLRQHLVEGYTINEKRLKAQQDKIRNLQETLRLFYLRLYPRFHDIRFTIYDLRSFVFCSMRHVIFLTQ